LCEQKTFKIYNIGFQESYGAASNLNVRLYELSTKCGND
jgi:hypothetical protein